MLPPAEEEDLSLLLARYVEGGGKQGPRVVVVATAAERLVYLCVAI